MGKDLRRQISIIAVKYITVIVVEPDFLLQAGWSGNKDKNYR
jgi:hypothetical protein